MPELIKYPRDNPNAASDDDQGNDNDDKKEEEVDDKECPSLTKRIERYRVGGDNCSNSDSDSKDERNDEFNQIQPEPMMASGFLTGQKHGIFTDSNEEDNYASEEDDNTLINSNRNSTIWLTKGKKHKINSKKKSRPPHTINPAIKY